VENPGCGIEVSNRCAMKKADPESTPMGHGIVVENLIRQLSGIEQLRGGSGHSDCAFRLTQRNEVSSFQWSELHNFWHGKCYIPM
jgi:hypothetical protein